LISKGNLEAAFAAFDRDKSGKISLEELREMLSGANTISEATWTNLIGQADQDGDGEIDLAEFAKLMQSCS
jgi:calcium-dependent protein kinase